MRDVLGNTGTASVPSSATTTASSIFGELGIMDLTANGGINPNTGNPWQAGDQYRLAFHTVGATGTRDGSSNNPADYNAYVTAEAQANPALAGSSWFAMVTVNLNGGTSQVLSAKSHVKDNTGTADLTNGAGIGGAGVPVCAMDGATCIARNNADIWNDWSNPFDGDSQVRTGSVHYSPFLDQFGNQTVQADANHGIASGLENFFGTHPDVAGRNGWAAGAVTTGGGFTFFSFTHPQGTLADDLSAVYQWSKDLLTYHADGATDGEGTTVTFSTSTDTGITTVTATISGGPVPDKLFVRVAVTQG